MPADPSPREPAPGPATQTRRANGPLAAGALPRWRVFPPLALGTVMATLDSSVVNIALPTLARSFRVPLTTIEWVVLAYVLTITGLLMSLGRLADRVGRRRMYGGGIAVFTVASALCAVSPGAGMLIAARALQGLGAAMMTANSSALLISSFPGGESGRALGAFGAVVGVGLALGPPLGGIVIGHLSWRWIFLVNLPLGILALRLLVTRVPPDVAGPASARPALPSAAAWCGSLVTLMLALSWGPARGWGSLSVTPLFAASALLLVVFALAERRAAAPLLPLRLLRGPVGLAVTLTLVANALSIAVGFHLPLYLEEVLGFDPARSGRWMAVLPVAALLLAPAAGRWSDRFGTRPLSVFGMALAGAGLVTLSGVGVSPSPGLLIGGMALIGVGLGLFTVPNSSALFSSAARSDLGLISGLQATMRNLGIAGGAAAMGAAVASRYAAHGGGALSLASGRALSKPVFALATRDAMLGMAAVAAVATALAWVQPSVRRGEPAGP